MTLPSGFQKGRFLKKTTDPRRYQDKAAAGHHGSPRPLSPQPLSRLPLANYESQGAYCLARLRRNSARGAGGSRPGRGGAGSERAVWRLQTPAPFSAESFPGGRGSSSSATRNPPIFGDRRRLLGVTALFFSHPIPQSSGSLSLGPERPPSRAPRRAALPSPPFLPPSASAPARRDEVRQARGGREAAGKGGPLLRRRAPHLRPFVRVMGAR